MNIITFKKELIEQILLGVKTQTRRRVSYSKKGNPICRYRNGTTAVIKANRFTKEVYGVIRIIGSEICRLGDITNEDAKKEGFKDRDEFIEKWNKIYGCYDPDIMVTVIDFVDEKDPGIPGVTRIK